MRVVALAVTLGIALGGCGDDALLPPTGMDGARPDAGDGEVDAGLDTTPSEDGGPEDVADAVAQDVLSDGAMDIRTDPGTPDVVADANMDSVDAVDAPIDAGCGMGARCPCPAIGTACGLDGSCPLGTVCIENTCGETLCLASGAPCDGDDDCPLGSACIDGTAGKVCDGDLLDCDDSRNCPVGFACEAGACLDRRTPCVDTRDCPRGFFCSLVTEDQGSFCEYIGRPCDSNKACSSMFECRDIAETGQTQCAGMVAGGTCITSSDCVGALSCETDLAGFTACGNYGACLDETRCGAGQDCADLWGDGTLACIDEGGTCATSADCASPEICATPIVPGPPSCHAGRSI